MPRQRGRGDRSGARLRSPQRQGDLRFADALLAQAAKLGVKIGRVLETHAHADHLSGAPTSSSRPAPRSRSASTSATCSRSSARCSTPPTCRATAPSSTICSRTASASRSAALDGEVIYTPGHTPACVSYKIGDAVFVGDTMFMPDFGTARADFPGGDAHALYRSIHAHSVAAGRRRGCSCATTTRRRAATNTPGRPRSARNGRATCTCTRA